MSSPWVSGVSSECGYDSLCSTYSQRLLVRIRLGGEVKPLTIHKIHEAYADAEIIMREIRQEKEI